ncbi:hypothetical protein CS022_14795 [Veronia nyctiphanis]|uniref:Auxin efflux carrier n=1 Tax=Veronia nyctiphanis TaxID=1278244 RepID=A0A4Q0YN58_9GAMM|nr:AEC family transporter [Veronia nyctiphanis]RXJ71825.1 hypothetical protein CS022_19340 [Veronia nyctiphanis]RXJ72576.1 hypothetical protein CS022_14795 [Veronia nyctiphanis]
MLVVVSILPVFLVSLFGFLTAKSGKLSRSDIQSLSKFTFSMAIPVMLFTKMSTLAVPDNIEWSLLLSYYLSVFIVFSLTAFIARYLFSDECETQSVLGFSATFSNAVVIGIPVIHYTLGDDAMLPLFMLISVHALTIYLLGFFFAERGRFDRKKVLLSVVRIFSEILKNPITLAIFSGLLVNVLPFSLPDLLSASLSLFSEAAIPLTLFVLGASISQFPLTFSSRVPLLLVVFKNLMLPLLVYLFSTYVFGLSETWTVTATVMASMPIGVNAYIFSQRYQRIMPEVATSILFSTVFSILSVPLCLWLLTNQ